MGRVCPGGDVVLLMLSLVLSDHEPRSTRVGKECDDGRAHGHDEIPDECFHVLAHKHFAPLLASSLAEEYQKGFPRFREGSLSVLSFSEDFPVRDSKDSLQGLESGLTNFGLNSASQLEKNIFPVRKVIFQRFLNHDAKIRHSSYPVVRCRAMSCDAGTFSLKSPKILPISLL